MIKNGNEKLLNDALSGFEKKNSFKYGKNGHFSTLRLGYREILLCHNNSDNRFVYRT